MTAWLRNLRTGFRDWPVLLLTGNIRDEYIDGGTRHADLSTLLRARALEWAGLTPEREPDERLDGALSPTPEPDRTELELRVWDPFRDDGGYVLRYLRAGPGGPRRPAPPAGELGGAPAPRARAGGRSGPLPTPDQALLRFAELLGEDAVRRVVVVGYLDKLVAFRQGGYGDEEQMRIARLEKMIHAIRPTNRLVLAALLDTMLPVELYTHSPKARLLTVPVPDKATRLEYVRGRLGPDFPHRELVADLTDGLYLGQLRPLASKLSTLGAASAAEIRRVAAQHRVGVQQDYWGQLSLEKLDGAFDWLTQTAGVKGQDDAVRRVVRMLYKARAGLSTLASGAGTKPRGVLFFAGPTGVGKTLLARKLAMFLFETEEAVIRLDMSELKEAHTVSKLIGSPPGYVGSERGGALTNAVRDRPFTVVLFDEIEKAHPTIMDIFLQILDDGRLTDSRGQTVFFSEAVIVFTSNVGARSKNGRGEDIPEQDELNALQHDGALPEPERVLRVREHFDRAVREFFARELSRPELLNRIGTNIVPFRFIDSPDVQRQVLHAHLGRIQDAFDDQHRREGHVLRVAEGVVTALVERHGPRMAEFGGRGITNAIDEEIMDRLAHAVLQAEMEGRAGQLFEVVCAGTRGTGARGIEVRASDREDVGPAVPGRSAGGAPEEPLGW